MHSCETLTHSVLHTATSFLHAEVFSCPGIGRMVKVPSGYLRHMTAKMLVPGRCLKLLDCVGQGRRGRKGGRGGKVGGGGKVGRRHSKR